MTTPADPYDPKSAQAPVVAAVATAESFGEVLRHFWERNSNAVYVLCGLVLAGIVVKGGWDYMAAQKQIEIGQEYAAATTPEMLRTFAASHEGIPLAGAAELSLGDMAYGDGRSADAVTAYEKAVAVLPAGVFASRARLGLAMSEVQAGRSSEGEAGLRQLSGDPSQTKAVRTEAVYQLASIAAAGGRADEVRRLAEQLVQIDPASPWTQRAFALQATLSASSKAAAPAPAPAMGVGVQPGKR